MKPLVVPAIIAKTQGELDDILAKVRGKVKRVQLDIMDGTFVENTSLDFDFELHQDVEYEAHLMVEDPLAWVKENKDKVSIAILQVETLTDIGEAIDYVKKTGLKVALAFNPETQLDEVLPYLSQLDSILILTVHPGDHCIEFLSEPLHKIKKIREIDDKMPIEVDGCMNPENAKLALECGASIIASGSYILNSNDIDQAIRNLEEAAG